jgi:hypothetical protein
MPNAGSLEHNYHQVPIVRKLHLLGYVANRASQRLSTSEVCRGGIRDFKRRAKNGEALICLQGQIKASRSLPVSGGLQVDGSIEIIQPYCQVFLQVENKFATL